MNEEAKAKDEYMESDEGRKACRLATLDSGQKSHEAYLRNRVERAFLAGLEAGKKIQRDRIKQHISNWMQAIQ